MKSHLAAITAVMLTLTACSDSDTTSPARRSVPSAPSAVADIQVRPEVATLIRGMRQSLFLAVRAANGDLLTDRAATWTSSDTAVILVSPVIVNNESSASIAAAVAYASRAGSATITARVGGRSARVAITVRN